MKWETNLHPPRYAQHRGAFMKNHCYHPYQHKTRLGAGFSGIGIGSCLKSSPLFCVIIHAYRSADCCSILSLVIARQTAGQDRIGAEEEPSIIAQKNSFRTGAVGAFGAKRNSFSKNYQMNRTGLRLVLPIENLGFPSFSLSILLRPFSHFDHRFEQSRAHHCPPKSGHTVITCGFQFLLKFHR